MDIAEIKRNLDGLQRKREDVSKQINQLEGKKTQILDTLKTKFSINSPDEIMPLMKDKRAKRDEVRGKIEENYEKLKGYWPDAR